MSHELWATYSVNDHLTPRRLAADIMLFDRLVFPVPETAKIPGRPDQPGPVEWTIDPAEWKRWEEAKPSWKPAAQQELLKLLAPVVRKVPWGPKDGGISQGGREPRRNGVARLRFPSDPIDLDPRSAGLCHRGRSRWTVIWFVG